MGGEHIRPYAANWVFFGNCFALRVDFVDQDICHRFSTARHDFGIHLAPKIRFDTKWSRDPPKWAKKGLFGLFWRLFYNFLKIWSDDCFQNACICRHSNYLYTHICVISEKKFGVRSTATLKFENGPFFPILQHF